MRLDMHRGRHKLQEQLSLNAPTGRCLDGCCGHVFGVLLAFDVFDVCLDPSRELSPAGESAVCRLNRRRSRVSNLRFQHCVADDHSARVLLNKCRGSASFLQVGAVARSMEPALNGRSCCLDLRGFSFALLHLFIQAGQEAHTSPMTAPGCLKLRSRDLLEHLVVDGPLETLPPEETTPVRLDLDGRNGGDYRLRGCLLGCPDRTRKPGELRHALPQPRPSGHPFNPQLSLG